MAEIQEVLELTTELQREAKKAGHIFQSMNPSRKKKKDGKATPEILGGMLCNNGIL
ncbi:hypothetical protein [Bacillus chungangensis]|uniref:Uncharacterized protein n=1 Tax=Bacillus chungangensis TaxID=587633 RepID=A0ABT9WZP8_9BACI|nr:hypothetical protein [Bacillus chungangensis]MDQ0178337.1 hypothetical protein [Bacillus chungangensis]